MPVIINEIDIAIQPPEPDSDQHVTASATIDDSAIEAVLRFLADRQRRVWAD